MAESKSLGELVKEARTLSKLTQEQLAGQVDNMTANDISKTERGQLIPTQNQLKQIAKATGVTQKSLLDAAKAAAASSAASGKTTSTAAGKTSSTASGKTTSAAGKTGTSGKTGSSGKTGQTASASKDKTTGRYNMQLTATEKKLIDLYREADSDKKKSVMSLLKGESQTTSELISSLLDGSKKPDEIITSLFSGSASGSGSGSQAGSGSGKTDDFVSSLIGAFMNAKK